MAQKRKNLIFILTDDQGAWALGANGNNEVKTPNLDKMAAEGVNFENFFCTSPVCSPARASILTGGMPSYHGVCDWIADGNFDRKDYKVTRFNPYYAGEKNTIRYLDGFLCYTDILASRGYDCALVGKWHLGDSVTPQHGFRRWAALPLGYSPYINPEIIENGDIHHEIGYVTELLTDKAIEYLGEMAKNAQEGDHPFYLSLHYSAPHTPWGRLFHPNYVHEPYRDCEFTSVPCEEMHPNAIYTCESPYYGLSDFHGLEEGRRELIAGYYGSITQVDISVGRLIEEVKRLNIFEDTIFIFTADNGMNLGQHGIWGKGNGTYPQNMYDSSVKVPFIVYAPGMIQKGKVARGMYSQYDIFPTLLEMLGIEMTQEEKDSAQKLPGSSFLQTLYGAEEQAKERRIVIYSEYGRVRMLRGKKYKFVRIYPNGPDELYDLEVDPEEKNNLAQKEEYAAVRAEMLHALEEWFEKFSDPEHSGLRDENYGNGQLCKNGSFAEGKKPFRKGACIGQNYFKFTRKKDRVYRIFAVPFMRIMKKVSISKIKSKKAH